MTLLRRPRRTQKSFQLSSLDGTLHLSSTSNVRTSHALAPSLRHDPSAQLNHMHSTCLSQHSFDVVDLCCHFPNPFGIWFIISLHDRVRGATACASPCHLSPISLGWEEEGGGGRGPLLPHSFHKQKKEKTKIGPSRRRRVETPSLPTKILVWGEVTFHTPTVPPLSKKNKPN